MSAKVFSVEEWQAAMLRAETAADKARAVKHLIAAAEERGRRRGVEEADRLRAALRDAAAALTLAGHELIRRLNEKREKMSTTEAVNDEVAEAVVRAVGDIRKALAPRDSGKET